MTLLEAALDALENNVGEYRVEGAKALLHQAIAEAEKQEPVADASAWWTLVMGAAASIEDALNCMRDEDAKRQAIGAMKHYREKANALYTGPQPAQQPLKPLTDEQIEQLEQDTCAMDFPETVRAIEAKLKEKNT